VFRDPGVKDHSVFGGQQIFQREGKVVRLTLYPNLPGTVLLYICWPRSITNCPLFTLRQSHLG
jgi:hypothetical protein